MKKNLLLIGSGGRIQNNFIPAISFLSSSFQIQGVYSRSAEKREAVAKRWNIPAVSDLDTVDFSQTDIVVISVTTSAVPGILQRIVKHAGKLTLVIDTPVFERLKDFKYIHLLKKFKAVRVAEDFMNFPQFELMRIATDEGLIGEVKEVKLHHTGYLHHGTALIRSFYRFDHASRSLRKKAGGNTLVLFSHTKGRKGLMVTPYRRLDGNIEIIGTTGVITTDNARKAGSLPVYIIAPIINDGTLQGYEIKSPAWQRKYVPEALSFLRAFDLDHKDDFNLLKTCGLIRIFESIDKENINSTYDFVEGAYDSIAGRMAERLPVMIDPFGKSLTGVLKILS